MRPTEVIGKLDNPSAEDIAELAAVWASTHSPEVAAVLEQAGGRYALAHPHPVPRGGLHGAWLELAADPSPADLSWLASSLTKHLPTVSKKRAADLRVPQRGLAQRLQAVAALKPDPRLAAAVAQALVGCPFAFERVEQLHSLYGVAFDQLCADGRQAEVLAAALRDPPARAGITRALLREVLPPLIERCARTRSSLSRDEEAAWRALLVSAPAVEPHSNEAALLRQVLERPFDDVARLVYADALAERGDPRGEFLSLQVSPLPHSAASVKRQQALRRAHQARWLGPLHRVFTHHVFHRGFLYEAALAHNAKAEPEVWQHAVGHPELNFVRRLMQGRGNASAYLGFLAAENGQRITDVDVSTSAVLSEVLRQPARPWRLLAFKRAPGLEDLRSLSRLQTLRSLEIDDLDDAQFVGNLRKSGLLERLASLEFRWPHYAQDLVRLLGIGTLRRVTFTSLGSCITVTKETAGFVVEGETEYEHLAKGVLIAVGRAQRVHLALADFRTPRPGRSVARRRSVSGAAPTLAWFDEWCSVNAEHHTVLKVAKTNSGGFHERLRLAQMPPNS